LNFSPEHSESSLQRQKKFSTFDDSGVNARFSGASRGLHLHPGGSFRLQTGDICVKMRSMATTVKAGGQRNNQTLSACRETLAHTLQIAGEGFAEGGFAHIGFLIFLSSYFNSQPLSWSRILLID
jgi:hypothetical protein